MRGALLAIASMVLLQLGCGAEVKIDSRPSESVAAYRIPFKMAVQKYPEDNIKVIEVEYNGTIHLFLQPMYGEVKPFTEVGTRATDR